MNIILDNGAFKPEFAHKTDAGADLRSPVESVVPAHGSVVIDTGVHVEIPEGYTIFLKSKSGLNVMHNLIGEGVVDALYTGRITILSNRNVLCTVFIGLNMDFMRMQSMYNIMGR